MFAYFVPVIYFLIYGHYFNDVIIGNENELINLGKFYFSITLVAAFNTRVLSSLYNKGML